MIGINALILNTATIIEALQEYLDARTQDIEIVVTAFDQEDVTDGTYRVTTERKKKS